MGRAFRQVDVFGKDPCSGNPVAVLLDAEGLDDESLRRFSAWSNLSECTFVYPAIAAGADYRVRIFSLGTELPFAGHPTLGTTRAWLDAGGEPNAAGLVVQECGAGLVEVRVEDGLLAFLAPPRIRSGAIEPAMFSTVVDILGVDPDRVVDAEWLDNGPGWIGVLLDGSETVLGLNPDASAHPGRWDIGVIGAHGPESAMSFELRAFFTDGTGPLREDPVTGSLNAAAAQWLLSSGRAEPPYVAAQGTAMGRHGRVHISADDRGIWVGGRAETVLIGEAAW